KMKLKSLLIGSAAVMAVSTGSAKAADAIVMAEPEPMEYVRICDVYGAGFYYIPGTETCMAIGGYYRFQLNFSSTALTWMARFAPSFDVRNETEWGTLRGFAEIEFDYGWYTAGSTTSFGTTRAAAGYAQNVNLNHAFIEIIGASGTLRMGKGDTPYARFLGYGSGNVFGGVYGFSNGAEISYTFNGSNGFSAILALLQDGDTDYVPDIEGGIRFAQGWGSVGVIAGYDESAATWGAKGVFRYNAPNGSFSAGLHVIYSSGAGRYAVGDPGGAAGNVAPWSILAHVKGQFTATVAGTLSAQWFSNTGGFDLVGGLDIRPVSGLRIRPEVRYMTTSGGWAGALRFDRSIP
ncbi:MAG: porin, partial [Rhizobiaceae bacterium]|nr:porin [Rhizobiaceae bacterium]